MARHLTCPRQARLPLTNLEFTAMMAAQPEFLAKPTSEHPSAPKCTALSGLLTNCLTFWERAVTSDLLAEKANKSDSPAKMTTKPKSPAEMAAKPESPTKTATKPEFLARMAAEPESLTKVTAQPESLAKMAVTSEFPAKMIATSEFPTKMGIKLECWGRMVAKQASLCWILTCLCLPAQPGNVCLCEK
ncbi:hypothetical protein Q8A67_012161 [Cirrhinus molitorella]|uniref:Uncharacterized protein n=1 Tax=Cirrhinus molitorella TaxID=172907 RepID=A0AA88PQB0_9TELE|nr:hypothetical protein Q8A67_012161 [Cirrhinus molitorella]